MSHLIIVQIVMQLNVFLKATRDPPSTPIPSTTGNSTLNGLIWNNWKVSYLNYFDTGFRIAAFYQKYMINPENVSINFLDGCQKSLLALL